MKTKTKLLSALFCAGMLLSFLNFNAQTKLLHYWHFNNTLPASGAGGIHFGTGKMNSDYSKPGVTQGYLRFVKVANCLNDTGYWDNLLGDSINQRPGFGSCCPIFGATLNNAAVRTRNPTDSMIFYWYIPTNKFMNIKLTWESMASSTASGPHRMNYKYSVDSGATWITTNLPKLFDSASTAWGKITLNLSGITSINNSNKLMLSLKTTTPNTGASGNIRYDNITVEGDSIVSSVTNYKCLSGNCVADAAGTFTSLASCLASNCGGVNLYKCLSGNCVTDAAGTFTSLASCVASNCGGVNLAENNFNLEMITIFPNPTSNNITIDNPSKESISVSITNIVGQVVYVSDRKENEQRPIDVSNLIKGLYYLNINEHKSNRSITIKFIKE